MEDLTEEAVVRDRVHERTIELLDDQTPAVRAEAARCPGLWGTTEDRLAVKSLAVDPQSQVRDEANRALERLVE
ncbi:hypothetical protein [Halopiger aswanensis]|uniref:hypothetical protein n=1 Tax=Halopiger aswanensis TaxID=148449 RepID=UPI000E70C2CB|nr:hypothetical protein [Halopiger aswanensis]